MATRVPKEPPEIRILNPYFIQEAAFTLIGLPFNNGLMGRGVSCCDPGRGRRGTGAQVPGTGDGWGSLLLPSHTYSYSLPPQNIPTLGSVAVTMALHGCDEVAVAGFGYDMSTPNAPLHYYETVRMAAIKEVWRRAWGGGGAGGFRHRDQGLSSRATQHACPALS